MSATGFVDGSGNDLITIFQPIGAATKIADVGYVSILNGDKDFSSIFLGYTSGTKANLTGFVYNGLDLSEWFQKIGAIASTPLTSTPAVEPTMIGSDYLYRFTTATTYTATWSPGDYTVRYLCVAGGGGGGRRVGAGGGAGGVLTNTVSFTLSTATSMTITVGNGGTGMSVSAGPAATNGGNSSITSSMLNVTSVGGGGGTGISFPGLVGQSGGSGAGGVYNKTGVNPTEETVGVEGAGTSGQGNSGGKGFISTISGYYTGGGGGGAGDFGGHGCNSGTCGYGGAGILSNITGTDTFYGGGGGGAVLNGAGSSIVGTGGIGGGGNGGYYNSSNATTVLPTSGTANTGGGGGGESPELNSGGNGGSGIVILRITQNRTTHQLSITAGPTLIPNMFIFESNLIYIFNTVGTYTVSFTDGYYIRYVCVAGGGGGGNWDGPGGGAGGVLTGSFIPNTGTNYTITVGNGGVGQIFYNSVPVRGENSSISTVATSIGGGSGVGKVGFTAGLSGGSGGGASAYQTPGSGTSGQGNNGGTGFTSGVRDAPGGGGGAGDVGGSGNSTKAGDGGVGIQSNITGYNLYYGGGGAGASQNSNSLSPLAVGGLGGGGRGGLLVYQNSPSLRWNIVYGANGAPNTGGGGGGCGYMPNGYANGNGGSGIVILRAIPLFTLPLTITPAISRSFIGIDFICTFTTATTYTVTWSPGNYIVRYLCVAGGGGGGRSIGGGGGAGGVLTNTVSVSLSVQTTMTITVGVGGTGMAANAGPVALKGGNSSITSSMLTVTSIGGGGGSGQSFNFFNQNQPGMTGGSGAGGSRYSSGPGTGTSGQGNSGGSFLSNNSTYYNAGGGGGAGGVGGNGTNTAPYGVGGVGISNDINGIATFYGGGGGGGAQNNITSTSGGTGGNGGGGTGGHYNMSNATTRLPTSGTANTGGGGGGDAPGFNPGGDGGSGIVIMRVTPYKDITSSLGSIRNFWTGSCGVSSSGQYAVIGLYGTTRLNGEVYYTNNYGSTWIKSTITLPSGKTGVSVRSIVMSSDGSKCAFNDANVTATEDIFFSTNYGANFSQKANSYPISGNVLSIFMSDDLNVIANAKFVSNTVIRSTNFLNTTPTWTAITVTGAPASCRRVAGNSTGSILYVTSGSGIFKSINTGTTWSTVSSGLPSAVSWHGISVSKDGSVIACGRYPGGVYVSKNSGVSFSQITQTVPTNLTWPTVVVSVDGSIIAVGSDTASTTSIYISYNSGATWSTLIPTGSASSPYFVDYIAVQPKMILATYSTNTNPNTSAGLAYMFKLPI